MTRSIGSARQVFVRESDYSELTAPQYEKTSDSPGGTLYQQYGSCIFSVVSEDDVDVSLQPGMHAGVISCMNPMRMRRYCQSIAGNF